MVAALIGLVLGFVVGILFGFVLGTEDYNENAYLLGKVVEAKRYEASDWERYLVVCVSWHGNLRLRPLGETDPRYAFWLDESKRATRLREIV